jgi:hypothetical protein
MPKLYSQVAPKPTHHWNIDRQDHQTKGNHPEPENGQKPEQSTDTQDDAQPNTQNGVARHVYLIPCEIYLWHFASFMCEPRIWGATNKQQKPFRIQKPLLYAPQHSSIAQLVEHSTVNRMVAGSSPARGASFKAGAEMHRLYSSEALRNCHSFHI